MVIDGLSITAIGMAIVFCFLIILVAAMKGLFLILKKFFPKSLVVTPPERRQTATDGAGKENLQAVVAAAIASIQAHQAANRG